MKPALYAALIGLMLAATGCGGPMAEMEQSMPEGCWNMQDTLELSFDNTDTSKVYAMWFPITFDEEYPYNNIHLRAVLVPPSGGDILLPARFGIVDPDGKWLAEKEGSKVPFDLLMSDAMRFNQTGKYRVRLYHYMRDSLMCGISSAGIAIDDADNVDQ